MILDINKLINSGNKNISSIGWLTYGREDQNGGLSTYELEQLLSLLTPVNFEDVEYEAFEKGKLEGFEEGYKEGLSDGKIEATMVKDKDEIMHIFNDLSAITKLK